MKRRGIKLAILGLSLTIGLGAFAGCSKGTDNSTPDKKNLSGSITLSGSSALLPLIEASAEPFQDENPDVTINAQAGGSGQGLTQVSEGSVDVGNSDVFAEEKLDAAKAKELIDHKVVAQGFAVVVNKNLNVTNLTKQQIQDIFSGKAKTGKKLEDQIKK